MSLIRLMLKWAYSHYMNVKLRSRNVTVMSCANVRDSNLEGWNMIWPHVYLRNCSIGLGSYVGEHSSFIDAKIGRFCSIAPNVKMVLGRHPTRDFVSTHPAFFSSAGQAGFTFVSKNLFPESKYVDEKNGIRVIIGNDVWIGTGVVILEGCTIGDGSIVGANSLVSSDVKPYSIVSGIPAQHVRYRFDEDERAFLIKYKWWNNDWNWLEKHGSSFSSLKQFMDKLNGQI